MASPGTTAHGMRSTKTFARRRRRPMPGLQRWRRFRQRAYKPQDPSIGYPLARWFARPAALPLSWLLCRLGVPPAVVTLIAAVVGLAAAPFIANGSGWSFSLGVLLLWVWYWLDHVDGQVARVTGQASLTGAYLDFLMHFVVHVALWWALAESLHGALARLFGPVAMASSTALFLGGLLAEAHGAAVAKAFLYHRTGSRQSWSRSRQMSSRSEPAGRMARRLLWITEVPNLLPQLAAVAGVWLLCPPLFGTVRTCWLLALAIAVPITRGARLLRWARGGHVERECQAVDPGGQTA